MFKQDTIFLLIVLFTQWSAIFTGQRTTFLILTNYIFINKASRNIIIVLNI